MAAVKFTIELTVEHSQVETFKKLAKQMNTIVRYYEPETIQCQWFFHEGDDKWYLTETFVNSDAFLKHLQDAGPKLEEILKIAEVSRFEVFGELSHVRPGLPGRLGVRLRREDAL